MDAVAAAEVQKAQASTVCPNPIIALNEMDHRSEAPGPLPAAAQRYRDAVLALMRALAADGATPFLLVPRRFTMKGTEDWWRQVGQVGWLVPEAYTPAPEPLQRREPVPDQPRRSASASANGSSRLTVLGIPASRIGLMLGFQSGDPRGAGPACSRRRPGSRSSSCSPRRGLAVARELGLSTVWSWGWGTFATPGSADPDKQAAACTYLWARDHDALRRARARPCPASTPTSRPARSTLAPTTQCRYDGGSFAHRRADRADQRRRLARRRADGAARAQPRRARATSARRRCCAPSAA